MSEPSFPGGEPRGGAGGPETAAPARDVRLAPTATYRLQLGPELRFEDAAQLAPYLETLGVSHVYLSPCLQAVEGSAHGYDVVDPTRVSEALGGAEGFAAMCAAFERHGIGRVLDVVPNHMATQGAENPWWWDVLENGPASRCAPFFDVDWDPPESWLRNKILLPVLGDQYGCELEAGTIRLGHSEGGFTVRYWEHSFPVAPRSLAPLLADAAERCRSSTLAFLADAHAGLPEPTVTERAALRRRHRDRAVLRRMLAGLIRERPRVRDAVDEAVAAVNGSPDALHELLERQSYRLASWHAARRDLDYRRFFDIHQLVGLRTEDDEVFRETHSLVLEWLWSGLVHGLRVDHPDGLRDPGAYFRRLRASAGGAWIVAEKILAGEERLPEPWPVDGTTGYEFLNLAGGLFVDPAGERPLTRLWRETNGGADASWETTVLDSKRLVLREILGSEVTRLSALFVQVCERHRRHRDHSRHELREALVEAAAAFPVYRSYLGEGEDEAGAADREVIRRAVETAAARRDDLPGSLLAFLGELLAGDVGGEPERELALRFQQLTGAAMAKGMEDTALYRFNRLVALNEVGGEPDRFGVNPAQFHRACIETLRRWPRTMLATSTHDTKRSEDVRARLAVLSEVPGRWREAVTRWSLRSERHRRDGLPDRAAEYLLYQTLVGAWPIDRLRLTGYLVKAAREAKLHTSWRRPDERYEESLQGMATGILDDPEAIAEIESFVASIAAPALSNSLALKLLALTAPGVPDVYQGTELLDLSLVDPDNRRPVDFAARAKMLDAIAGSPLDPERLTARPETGAAKLWLVRQALHLRRRRPELYREGGDYLPVEAAGPRSDHVVAFLRGGAAMTLVPRLTVAVANDWQGTTVELPAGRWRNLLTGDDPQGGEIPVAGLLRRFPVALLERVEERP